MGRLILIRHGETEFNKKRLLFGWLDPELNESGISQSYATREIIKKYEYSKIFSSPLKRALKTSEIINHKGIDVEVFDQLKELNFGIFEGFSYEEILERYPEEAKMARDDWKNYSFITGESPKMLQKRAVDFVETNIDLEKEDVVLVTHWGIICTLLSHYLSGELNGYWKFKIKNGGVAILDFSDGYVSLEGLNIGE